MRIFLKEIMNDVARAFGYVPKEILDSRMTNLERSEQALLENISTFHSQIKEFARPKIDQIILVLDESKSKKKIKIIASGTCYRNELGYSDCDIGDVVFKQLFNFVLNEVTYTKGNYLKCTKYAEQLAKYLSVKVEHLSKPWEPIEEIIGSAIHVEGITYWLPRPARHHHVHKFCRDHGIDYLGKEQQGFYTTADRFVDRRDALIIARAAGQLLSRHEHPTELFSESVW